MTNLGSGASFRLVLLARRTAILLLLALWLPAALHCRLEAAGLMPAIDCCATTQHEIPAGGCIDDACGVAEGAFTKPVALGVDAPAPVLCACLLCAHLRVSPPTLASPPVTGVIEAAEAPPELARTWAFVARAALPARAPSFVS